LKKQLFYCGLIFFGLILISIQFFPAGNADVPDSLDVKIPPITLSGIPINFKIQLSRPIKIDEDVILETTDQDGIHQKIVGIKGKDHLEITFEDLVLSGSGKTKLTFLIGPRTIKKNVEVIPGILTILPSIVAIILAFLTRQVILSLLFGVWMGAFFIYDFNPFISLYRMIDTVMISVLYNENHLIILIFSLMLGGMVGIISRAGGTYGIVNMVAKFARSARSAQIVTWAMGVVIFFDDYANTLLVGNTMRAFTDRLKVSREKLSYIVDSTAAPVTCVAVITTWIGFEIGLINDLNLPHVDGFQTFISSLPYNFYPFLAILMVFYVASTRKDFGPMLKAESRARSTGKVLSDTAVPLVDSSMHVLTPAKNVTPKWYNAVIPILTVIATIIIGLYVDGKSVLGDRSAGASLREIYGSANSLKVLMWGSFNGVGMAAILTLIQRLLKLKQLVDAWITGMKSMVIAMIILVMAWSLTSICLDLNTASYVAYATKDMLSAHFLPLMTFLIAAFIGFATGTSWGTMGILIPIVLPLAVRLNEIQALPEMVAHSVFMATVAAVLSGSVFGDHCSPISDTTIMSSMASGADHIDHVRTQLPYAALVAIVACVMGYLPSGYGITPLISFLIGAIFLFLFLKLFGKTPSTYLSEETKS